MLSRAGIPIVSLCLAAACSPATMGMNRMADTLAATAGAYGRDDDPEFVRAGAPATLKMVEMMLDTRPAHPGLLLTACSGFTQYAYAFLHNDSEMAADPAQGRDLRERAVRMYDRARGYCLRALAITNPGIGEALAREPLKAETLLAGTRKEDVGALYWSGVAWAGELSLAGNQLARLPELAAVRALLERALALDEAWGRGAIHEAMIAIEGLPALLGGSRARARHHLDRAVTLSEGRSAFAYVTFATSVSVAERDRAGFERLLKQALAVNSARTPDIRLANVIAQKRARFFLAAADRLFR